MSVDKAAQSEMFRRGIQGVPAFIIGDEAVVGLDKARVLSLIDYKVINCPGCNAKMRIPKDKGTIVVTCKKCEQKFKIKT